MKIPAKELLRITFFPAWCLGILVTLAACSYYYPDPGMYFGMGMATALLYNACVAAVREIRDELKMSKVFNVDSGLTVKVALFNNGTIMAVGEDDAPVPPESDYVPQPGTPAYIEVVRKSCALEYVIKDFKDRGDKPCPHNYAWDCQKCPCVVFWQTKRPDVYVDVHGE